MFGNARAVVAAVRRALANLVPPPDMLISEWAEKNVQIAVGNAIPGPINFDNAPYQRGMLDAPKEPGCRRCTYMTGAQLGKTTVQQCQIGYFVEHDPRSQIFVQPTQGDVQTFLETKLRPMLEANPSIAKKMAKPRGREGVNNSRIISYIGGWLMFSWAGSPKTLRGRSAPVTHADEIDGMDATPEGDPGELLDQRSATFGDQRMRTESSTPTVKGASRIETAFELGDQRRYYVACPECKHAQYFKWENVSWVGRVSTCIADANEDLGKEHDPDTAVYCCEVCGTVWDDGVRIAAIRDAERNGHGWKAAKPFKGHASFHAPEMLSTFRRLRDIVQSYLGKLALGDMQSFVNVSLAETYEEGAEKNDPNTLMARAYEFAAPVPMDAVYITAGIDMQPDRLEAEAVAWNEQEESWSVEYKVFYGDPLVGDVWDDLDDWLASGYMHESGRLLPISGACLDTGGNKGYTQCAYDYLEGKTGRRLFGIKGAPGWDRPVVERALRKKSGKRGRKVDLFLVGVDGAKKTISRRLGIEAPGPGYCHFPIDREREWYEQLTAEKLVTHYVKGQPVRHWSKPDKARNEALDCRVYAYAALKIMKPSFRRLADRLRLAPQQTPAQKFAQTVAETAVRLNETLTEIKEVADAVPEQTADESDIPHEGTKVADTQTAPVFRSRRVLKAKQRKGNFATKW